LKTHTFTVIMWVWARVF